VIKTFERLNLKSNDSIFQLKSVEIRQKRCF